IMIDDDLYDLSYVEAEFPAIVINDAITPQDALQCKSQVSTPINNEIDFKISFDESDDEDYTIICDKNSFSFKVVSVNNFKTDSENDSEKVVPSIPLPEPAISCFDDLDFFKDFEKEFPAINIGLQGWIQRVRVKPIRHMALPPREQRHIFLRYEGLEYSDTDITNFKVRLARIHRREVHRVPVFDFGGLPDLMAEGLSARMFFFGKGLPR
ncbi:hypothetical protein Tco_1445305, partial [Tanacetum coccineum]